jgi:hypothetical protein
MKNAVQSEYLAVGSRLMSLDDNIGIFEGLKT